MHDVGPLALSMAVGDVHTIDPVARLHYTLLLGKDNSSKPFTPTSWCEDHGSKCAAGSSCCCEPPSALAAVTRADDTPEVIQRRYRTYKLQSRIFSEKLA